MTLTLIIIARIPCCNGLLLLIIDANIEHIEHIAVWWQCNNYFAKER